MYGIIRGCSETRKPALGGLLVLFLSRMEALGNRYLVATQGLEPRTPAL